MRNAVLVSAVRTPVGKMGGVFRTIDRLDMTDVVIQEAIKRAGVDPAMVEENIWGNSPLYRTPSRYVWLHAGMPVETACLTVNRGCGTGLSAITTACAMITTGVGDVYMAGGVEQDSRRYFYLHNENPYENGAIRIDYQYSSPKEPYGNPNMLTTAENVAEKYGITRRECDEYACRSQKLALQGYEEGLYPEHIVPITVPQRKADPLIVDTDEILRPGTTVEALSKLQPVAGGVCTGGNSSPLNDGAAACVLMEEEKARSLGLKPLMRFVDFAVAGVDPRYMGLGPVSAMQKVMKRNSMKITDFSFIECNEAFAPQVLACQRELNIPMEILNIRGGAIALGHPYSATGISLAAKAAGIFKRQGGERCAITFCVGGGQGVAAIFENCD